MVVKEKTEEIKENVQMKTVEVRKTLTIREEKRLPNHFFLHLLVYNWC